MASAPTAVNSQPITDWSSLFGSGLGSLSSYLGNQSATSALTAGEQNGINTQQQTQGQLYGIYGNQTGLGNQADTALGTQLGISGAPANYSAFNNSPGYQFAIQQGDQAINRNAAAQGSLYTPQTMASLSQYNTGYASQNYNNYISQLLQSAGLGASGNQGLASGVNSTGANISQLQQNQGNANAGGAANNAGIASNLLSRLPYGQIGSGVSNLFGGNSTSNNSGVLNGSSSLFGGGTSAGTGYSDYNSATGQGSFSNNSLFGQYANSSGYSPTSGSYSGPSDTGGSGFGAFSSSSGYNPTTGDYSGGGDLGGF